MIDEAFWRIAAVGFAAQMIDVTLCIAYGLTAMPLLPTSGYLPAATSATVHLAETEAIAVNAGSHHQGRKVDWALGRSQAITGVLGGVIGANLLATDAGEALRPVVSACLAAKGAAIRWKVFRKLLGIRSLRGLEPPGSIGGGHGANGGDGSGSTVSGTLFASGHLTRHMVGSAIAAESIVTTAITVAFTRHLGFREPAIAALALVVGGMPVPPFAALILRVASQRALIVSIALLIAFLGFHNLWRAISLD